MLFKAYLVFMVVISYAKGLITYQPVELFDKGLTAPRNSPR